MIDEILTALGVPFRETQFIRSPENAKTYAVYFDDVSADGPDGTNRIFTHDYTVELYEKESDPEVEKKLEVELNVRGVRWSKQSRYWLQDVRRYQVIYEFSYIEKI